MNKLVQTSSHKNVKNHVECRRNKVSFRMILWKTLLTECAPIDIMLNPCVLCREDIETDYGARGLWRIRRIHSSPDKRYK